jgi:low affinity Fe/Cu permease
LETLAGSEASFATKLLHAGIRVKRGGYGLTHRHKTLGHEVAEDREGTPLPRAVDFARQETEKRATLNTWFSGVASAAAQVVGSAWIFFVAIGTIIVWAITGPMFHFSDTWQLIINTGTTIITFLMVFLIQNTQNRDAKAIHLKLNELIHAVTKAHDELIDVEKLSDEELKTLDAYYEKVRKECERRRMHEESAA